MLDKAQIDAGFIKVKQRIYRQFKKNPDVDALLFLIGIRELGLVKRRFNKEQKQDLMHIAVCRLLSDLGYYALEGLDADGWPHWVALKPLPKMDNTQQEYLLKQQIIRYFETLK
ncbi:MAG: hypothetical protein SFW35_12540 [Chitinophagales bacterium]|nr:hypothetical protein [Chitinophagales bacterium]